MRTAERHHVFLVPGFFGFTNLGEFVYFGHVRRFLIEELRARGVDAHVVPVQSHPTGSVRVRARDLAEAIYVVAGKDEGPIHLVGHSTGGLDCRYLLNPGAQLGDDLPVERFAQRVRTLVTVATPHRGTPLASFFQGLYGQRLLQILSLFTADVLRRGRLPISMVFRVVGAIMRADDRFGWRNSILDQLFSELLADFSPERQRALSAFLKQMVDDQALIQELTPREMESFNQFVHDRPSVRYASVVTRARPPSLKARFEAGISPYAQVTHTLYAFLQRRARQPGWQKTELPAAQERALRRSLGLTPTALDNDGIVPTRSQPWGTVLTGVRADHLDVIGHFPAPDERPAHFDWLLSRSGFRRPHFEAVWSDVASFLLADA